MRAHLLSQGLNKVHSRWTVNSAENHFNFQIISKSWDHYEFKVTRLLHSWMTRQWNASLKELQVTYMTSLGICFYWPNTWCYLKDASKNVCLSCKPQIILSGPVLIEAFFAQGIAKANFYYIYLWAQKVNCFRELDSQFFPFTSYPRRVKHFGRAGIEPRSSSSANNRPYHQTLPPDFIETCFANLSSL